MEPLLRRLSTILAQEVAQYRKLLEILPIERQALVGSSAERVNQILKQQETLILELKALEEARIAVMNKLVALFQTSTQKLTLVELASQVEDPFASEYKQLSDEFGELLEKLETFNRDNAYLIGRSLDNVNSALRLFASSDLFGVGYSDTKKLKPRQGKQFCRAV